jgi:branched-subunit amino acid transport protein
MSVWIVLLAVGGGSYALRLSMFLLLGRHELPGWTARPLALVAPSAIGALVASMTLTSRGNVDVAPMPDLIAIAVGFALTRRTGNVMHAIAAGLPTYWMATILLS